MSISNKWETDGESVWPIADLKPHIIDSDSCWCRPFYDGAILVHNSLDGRESYEKGRKPS